MSDAEPGLATEALTFDCYGTLIDWTGGISAAVAAMPSLEGCDVGRLLADRERSEAEIEAGEWIDYDTVLERSLLAAAERQGRRPSADELRAFAQGMGSWPAHADGPAALARLASRYRLAILSNVQTATLRRSVEQLGVPFEHLVTAEELRSYKPARAHLDEGLRRLDLPAERVLHVAQSLFHDVRPCLALGRRVAWVDRKGEGVQLDPAPELVVPDLARLADALGV